MSKFFKLNIEEKILENKYILKKRNIKIILFYFPKVIHFEITNITNFNNEKIVMLLPIFDFEIKKYNFKCKFITNDIDLLSVSNRKDYALYLFKLMTYSLFTYD